ncbi:MAG TPA: hypothetical protein VK939_02190 [Longimicrobiales bacterium]|nr:hypothetical protein [Longimicrobiales bacterium]
MIIEGITGIPRTLLFPAFVALAATISLLACYNLLRGIIPDIYRETFIVVMAVALFVVPGASSGQREHLMLIMSLPYMMACAARARGIAPTHPWLIGLAAGLGFAIKPHFLLAPVLLEGWLMAQTRRVWSGTIAVAATVLGYGVATLILTPQYLPMMSRLGPTYMAAGTTFAESLLQWRSLVVGTIVVLALASRKSNDLQKVLGIATFAWLVMAVLQMKKFYWAYHYLPALAGALMLSTVALIGILSTRRFLRLTVVYGVMIGLIAVADVVGRPGSKDTRWWQIANVKQAIQGERALILSRGLSSAWPAVTYANAEWNFAFPSIWSAGTPEGLRFVAARAVAALQAQPTIVLVPDAERWDPMADLLRDSVFRDAWASYYQTDSIIGYRVYRRH